MKNRKEMMIRSLSIVKKYFPKVEKVEDGDAPIVVEVTNADSNTAAVRNHEACAMAVACKRKMKADGVIISIATAYIIKGKTAIRYGVPNAVQREIVSFDRDAGFAAGEYQLVPHSPMSRIGETHHTNHTEKVTGTPQKRNHHTAGIRTVLGSREG
jgi:hypothetical protein